VPKVTDLTKVEAAAQAAIASIPTDAAAAAADASKIGATVKADVTAAKADVVAADTKLTAFIKANAGKIAIGVLVAAALLVWKLI
jgi:hypothetical protein